MTSFRLGAALRRRGPAAKLLSRFESLGDNCEFGFVQRAYGAEPLGLFRFSALPLPALLVCLETRLSRLAPGAALSVQTHGVENEHLVHVDAYGFFYHTGVAAADLSESELLAREARKLAFLARAFLETLEGAEKIFVVKQNEPAARADVEALVARLRAFHPGNELLWVVSTPDAGAAGSVERLAPGLLRGRIEAFAPYDEAAHPVAKRTWLRLCRRAAALVDAGELARA